MREVLIDKDKKTELEKYIIQELRDYRSDNGMSICDVNICTLLPIDKDRASISLTYTNGIDCFTKGGLIFIGENDSCNCSITNPDIDFILSSYNDIDI
jgi:hypothetical protein